MRQIFSISAYLAIKEIWRNRARFLLVSLVIAQKPHDMGYMGTQELSLRLRDSFDTLESMERLRGHFLNWYDTRSLAPLPWAELG